jgi:putative hemolysin
MLEMLEERPPVRELARAGRLSVRLARGPRDVEAAQRLRWQVFSEELGARLPGGRRGLDLDPFDRFCEHLIVEDESSGDVVGTYRVLFPDRAREAGGLYIESEFFTDRLRALKPGLVELGRSCVRRDFRTGAAIMLLWSGLAELMSTSSCRHLIGCASVPLGDEGHLAASLWRRLWADHASSEAMRVFPKRRLPLERLGLDEGTEPVVPPLLKGYLRAGGVLLGDPHVDPEFGCADFPILLELERLSARYSRRFARG